MKESPPLPDAAARARALLELERSLLVEAGAGSGKTSLLAGRVALLLASGVRARDIVAITFTEASASELLERIELYVGELRARAIPGPIRLGFPAGLSDAQSVQIERASQELDELTCTTIHGFCQRLITPYPVEGHIDPGAQMADPATAQIVHEELLEAWLSERFGQERPDDFLVELVRRDAREALSLIRSVADFLRIVRTAHAPQVAQNCASAWGLRTAIEEFVQWYAQCGVLENKTAAELEDLGRLAALLEGVGTQTLSGRQVAALLSHARPSCCHSKEPRFLTWRKKKAWADAAKTRGLSKTQGEMLSEQGRELYDICSTMYGNFVAEIAGVAAARFVQEFDALKALYAERKRKAALLDFDDLLFHARDLLASNEAVRAALAQRYPRILVDEFQDTDPLQAEILWRLCGEGEPGEPWQQRRLRAGSLFLVGDPKQAIYRFRGADIGTYLQAKNALCAQDSDAVLEVSANFRSVAPILHFVNERFASLLAVEREQPGFTALIPVKEHLGAGPALAAFDVSLDERHKDEKGKLIGAKVREREAEVVADLLVELTRTYRPGDIALLAPTGTQLWVYERALDARGIPLATQAGKGFFRRQEVQDLIAVARVLADARDTLALGALLRGPLVGLSEEEIADAMLALGVNEEGKIKSLSLWSETAELGNPVLARTLEMLQCLARSAACTTPYHVMAQAVEELGVRSLVRARQPRAAERGLANVELFLEMARAYDARGLAAFARAMRMRWEDSESHVEGRPDSEREAVSLVTMHSSKGLEWPVVIPINTMGEIRDRTRFFHRREDDTVHFKLLDCAGPDYADLKEEERKQQERERVRLWYVALTRARDLLLLPKQSERSESDWLSLVELGIEKLPLYQPAVSLEENSDRAVSSNLEEEAANEQDAAAWEREAVRIAVCKSSVRWSNPSRHEEKISVESGTLLPAEPLGEEAASEVQGSRERGVVLHKLLEEVLGAETSEDELEARAGVLLAELGLSRAALARRALDPAELAACVRRGLNVPEVRELRTRLLPEVPVYAAREDVPGTTTLVAGVIDALSLDAQGNVEVAIDWKSDVEPGEKQVAQYREQVREYLAATGAQRGLVVFLTSGRVSVVSCPPGKG